MEQKQTEPTGLGSDPDETLKIRIPSDLYRAYQRCTWILVHETGRKPLDIMREMVHDFLVKHGC
ncbi:MAG: hypothetical protein KJ950_07315 [Proteobacteria bacterium]|nr:hypothetical protein [Pseudomonadota bacterium]MBU1687054.1 hypothetical protein [Pseudomonadota bacterium]